MPALPFSLSAIADLETLGDHLVPLARAVVRAGLPWLCLRARAAGTAERIRLGREVLAEPGVFLTVHGDPAACRELGAPGLHLPSRGGDLAAARRQCPNVLLGVSCHDRGEVERAAAAGADYAWLSPFFAPTSKPLEGRALGADGFRRLREGVSIPVLALGGVTPERLAEAARAGAAGAAVLGSLFLAADPEASARRYRQEAERVFGGLSYGAAEPLSG